MQPARMRLILPPVDLHMSTMTIEISGGGFSNKGAELMLRTTVARLRETRPDLRIAVEPGVETPYERRAEVQLAHIFPNHAIFPLWSMRWFSHLPVLRRVVYGLVSAAVPPASDRVLGLCRRKSCDALVDIAGYSYGDGFKPIRTTLAVDRARSYARRGKPVILMPQMFGPFRNPKVRSEFRRLCDLATRIYARESRSYEAVREVIGDDPRLRIAPDITIFSGSGPQSDSAGDLVGDGGGNGGGIAGDLGGDWGDASIGRFAVLVPNERMLDQGRKDWGDSYLPRLVAAGLAMHSAGIRPMVVVHSGEAGDAELADRIVSEIESQAGRGAVGRFTHPHPKILKAFIARSEFVIGSRFHAIVAALSSGVPAVSLGWAHKYEALAEDFGVPSLQHKAADPPSHLHELIALLADESRNAEMRRRIATARESMQVKADAMWADVRELLRLPQPRPEVDGTASTGSLENERPHQSGATSS